MFRCRVDYYHTASSGSAQYSSALPRPLLTIHAPIHFIGGNCVFSSNNYWYSVVVFVLSRSQCIRKFFSGNVYFFGLRILSPPPTQVLWYLVSIFSNNEQVSLGMGYAFWHRSWHFGYFCSALVSLATP